MSQHAAVQQEHPQDEILIGGDLNQDNLVASTLRALPQNRLSGPAAELESADAFSSWMRATSMRLLCPVDGFCAFRQQYGRDNDNHKRILDYWRCSKNAQDLVYEVVVDMAVTMISRHLPVGFRLRRCSRPPLVRPLYTKKRWPDWREASEGQ